MIHSAKKRFDRVYSDLARLRTHSKVCRKSNTTQRSLEFWTKRKQNLYFSEYRVTCQQSKTLIVNICKQNWKTVANVAFQHEQIRPELSETLWRTVSRFSNNNSLTEELSLSCPFWTAEFKEAIEVRHRKTNEDNVKTLNSMDHLQHQEQKQENRCRHLLIGYQQSCFTVKLKNYM